MGINNADPHFQSTAFICPHCHKNEHQIRDGPKLIHEIKRTGEAYNLWYSECQGCKGRMVWLESYIPISLNKKKRVHTVVFPVDYKKKFRIKFSKDTPRILIDDLKEASSILDLSPRGACALLRLALQKFLDEIIIKVNGKKEKTIDDSIKYLLEKKFISDDINNIMHTLRIVGNESVHPGQMDLKDDKETALKMFDFFNFLIKTIITDNKEKIKMFDMLPENKKKDAIKENQDMAKVITIDVIGDNNKATEYEPGPSINPRPYGGSKIPLGRGLL